MELFKAHGLGNDYLVLESGEDLRPADVVAICDRHRGVGGDGILEPVASGRAHAGVRIWNPDGSVAEKSGNGLRIYAWWLCAFRGAPPSFTVETAGLLVGCAVSGLDVDVEMGRARVGGSVPLTVDGQALVGVPVDVGNPHCVLFRDEADLDALPWRRWGEVIETDPAFPRRTNVQIARVTGPRALELRVWERGAGPTLASGSSACAVAAAAVHSGRTDPGEHAVSMPGGSLSVTVRADGGIRLRGPVGPVGRFTTDPRFTS